MSYIIFARWFGIISVILALGILFNLSDAKAMAQEMVKDATGYIMGGVLPIIFGSLALMHQNDFNLGWSLVVSIIGLCLLLLGAFRALFVYAWKKIISRYIDIIPALFALFGLMFGLILLYVGYIAPLVQFHNGI